MQASCSIDCWMETSKRIQCKCNPEPQTFCTAHILKHFSEPGEHIISFSVEDPSSLMRIYIKFLTGFELMILGDSTIHKALDLKLLVDSMIQVSPNNQSYYFNGCILEDNVPLAHYDTQKNSPIIIKLDCDLDTVLSKASSNQERFSEDINFQLFIKQIQTKFWPLSLSSFLEFFQVGGDPLIAKFCRLTGLFIKCTYIGYSDEEILRFSDFGLLENECKSLTPLVSPLLFNEEIQSNENLKIIFLFNQFDPSAHVEFWQNNLVFGSKAHKEEMNLAALSILRFDLQLLKPLRNRQNYEICSDLMQLLSKTNTATFDTVQAIKIAKLNSKAVNFLDYISVTSSTSIISSPESLELIEKLIKERVNSLHRSYFYNPTDKIDEKIDDVLILTCLIICRHLKFIYLANKKSCPNDTETKIEYIQKYSTGGVFINDQIILEIIHLKEISSLSLTLLISIFIDFTGSNKLKQSLQHPKRLHNVPNKILSTMNETYEKLLTNQSVLERYIVLDNADASTHDLDLIRHETNELKSLIPAQVISIPQSVRLAGKTLLGGIISISENPLHMCYYNRAMLADYIYTLRHEISHKKWCIKGTKMDFISTSPKAEA